MDKQRFLLKGQSITAGFMTFFSQLILLRQVFSLLDTNELNIGFFYFSWLSFMAAGAFFLKKGPAVIKISAQVLFTSFSFFISVALFNYLVSSGDSNSFGQISIFKSFFIILSGVCLPAIFAGSAIVSISDSPYSIISMEAAGSLVAGLLFSLGGGAFLSTKTVALAIMLPSGLLFILLSLLYFKEKKLHLFSFLILSAAVAVLLFHKECPNAVFTGKSTVTFKKTDSVYVYNNGKYSFTWPDSGYLPPSALADYLANGGKIHSAGNIPMALAVHIWRKKSVILHVQEKQTSSKLASLANLSTFPEISLSSPFLINNSSLLILPPALPLTISDNKFFTTESFERWKKIAGKEGVLLMNVPIPGQWVSKPWLMAVSTLLSTAKTHFSKHAFIDCEGTWLAVSNKSDFLEFVNKVLSKEELKGYASLNTSLEQQLTHSRISTQEKPLLYIYTRAAFDRSPFSKFIARASFGNSKSFVFYNSNYFSFAVVLLFLFFVFARKRQSLSPENADDNSIGTMVFFTSAWAMALQIVLLLNLQGAAGNIILDAGLVSGFFMLFFSISARIIQTSLFSKISTPMWALAVSGFTVLLMLFLKPASHSIWISSGISALSGFLTGGTVSSALTSDGHRKTSLVFGWDNAGAAFGSLVAGTVLLHLSGSSHTVLLMGILTGITAIPAFMPFLNPRVYHPLRSRTWPWPQTALLLTFVTIFLLLVATAGRSRAPVEIRHPAGKCETKPFPHCISVKDGKKHLTVDSVVFPETLKIRGYAGPVGLKLTFDSEGIIRDVQIGENIETPSFIKSITPWSKKFIGKGPKDDLYSKDRGVDTVSGATMSTKAIRDTIEITRTKVLTYLKLDYSGKKISSRGFSILQGAIVISLFIFAVLFSFVFHHKALRLAFLAVTMVTLGIYYNWTISIVDGGLFFLNALPGPPERLLLVCAAIALAIMAGPLWCGILCPLGAIQELIYTLSHALGRLINLYKGPVIASTGLNNVKSFITSRASFLKYIILASGIIMLAFSGDQKFTDWDPLSWFFSFSFSPWRIVAIIMIITSSIFLFRPHCRFICPVGAFFSLFNHIALLSRKLGIRKYPECDYGVKGPSDITCIRCQRCCITKQKK